MREQVVPALERSASDERQPFPVRQACWEALDAWDGRVKAARAKASDAALEARIREDIERHRNDPPPALEGSLTISGRILGPSDTPLPGFAVVAVRDDNRCTGVAKSEDDGSFRIERLVAGEYRVAAAFDPTLSNQLRH